MYNILLTGIIANQWVNNFHYANDYFIIGQVTAKTHQLR